MTKKPKLTEKSKRLAEPSEDKSHEVPEDGLGSRMRAAREARGISQTALAEHSKTVDPDRKGVSPTVIVGYWVAQALVIKGRYEDAAIFFRAAIEKWKSLVPSRANSIKDEMEQHFEMYPR